MINTINPLIFLTLAWLGYFIFHSLFASLWLKRIVANYSSKLMPFYRLVFNVLAVLALLPILAFKQTLSGDLIWSWQGNWLWFSYVMSLLAIIGFIHSLKFYDMQEFMGIRQLKEHNTSVEDQEHLHFSPYHRFVRHPWYFFGIVLIWLQPMDTAWLVSSMMLTLYFWLGSKLEDRKLVTYYGERYETYMKKVCGIFPLPWRTL